MPGINHVSLPQYSINKFIFYKPIINGRCSISLLDLNIFDIFFSTYVNFVTLGNDRFLFNKFFQKRSHTLPLWISLLNYSRNWLLTVIMTRNLFFWNKLRITGMGFFLFTSNPNHLVLSLKKSHATEFFFARQVSVFLTGRKKQTILATSNNLNLLKRILYQLLRLVKIDVYRNSGLRFCLLPFRKKRLIKKKLSR